MASAWVLAIPPGVHTAPQGELVATPDRCNRWASQARRMMELGIRLPVSWGHVSGAMPDDGAKTRDDAQYARARFNAGYIEDARTGTDGGTEFKVDVPGAEVDAKGRLVTDCQLPNGLTVKAAIGEVSAKIVPSWTDGKGRIWKDAVAHLALVPLPVVTGQSGFRDAAKELATLQASDPKDCYLGRATLMYELATGDSMADDTETDAEAETPPSAAAPPQTPAAPPVQPDKVASGGTGADFAHCMRVLDQHGLHLPPGTTADNLVERICVIGHHDDENADAGKKGVEDDEGDEVEGEGGYDGQASGGGGGNVEEAQRPIMMSTLSDADPLMRRMFEQRQNDYRSRCLKRIDKMSRCEAGDAPFLPRRKADQLRAAFGSYELSTTPEGDVLEQRPDIELAAYWEAYQGSPQAKKAMKRGAAQARRPDEHDDAEAQEAAGDELAELAGAKRKK